MTNFRCCPFEPKEIGFRYLVGNPEGIEEFTEHHEVALFTHEEYVDAFRKAGLEVEHDHEGHMGRGLYIGARGERPRFT